MLTNWTDHSALRVSSILLRLATSRFLLLCSVQLSTNQLDAHGISARRLPRHCTLNSSHTLTTLGAQAIYTKPNSAGTSTALHILDRITACVHLNARFQYFQRSDYGFICGTHRSCLGGIYCIALHVSACCTARLTRLVPQCPPKHLMVLLMMQPQPLPQSNQLFTLCCRES